jgi:pyrimidine operon attenuation protein / uracil phosphoribosyltransferase
VNDGWARIGIAFQTMPHVMTDEDIGRALRRIAHEILERHRGADTVVLVGVHTRGVDLARRLAALIADFEDVTVPVGELDVLPYRDDQQIRPRESSGQTSIPFRIEGTNIVLVDDVLYTGRTVRAALDALADIGRAEQTELAVLVDRGHRQLPIRPDYVGKNLPTSHQEVVRVRLAETDQEEGVWVERLVAV